MLIDLGIDLGTHYRRVEADSTFQQVVSNWRRRAYPASPAPAGAVATNAEDAHVIVLAWNRTGLAPAKDAKPVEPRGPRSVILKGTLGGGAGASSAHL